MMERLEARGRTIAGRAQREMIVRLAERIGEAVPGIEATPDADGVTLTGRGLMRRLFDEPALRWIGSLAR